MRKVRKTGAVDPDGKSSPSRACRRSRSPDHAVSSSFKEGGGFFVSQFKAHNQTLRDVSNAGKRLVTAAFRLPLVLSSCVGDGLPLHVRNCIGSAAGERHNMIFDVTGPGSGRAARQGAGMQPLKFMLNGL